MTIAKLSKKEINEAIEVRRTLVDEIEENIFEIPDFFYSLQESGLQPEDDDKLSEDFLLHHKTLCIADEKCFSN